MNYACKVSVIIPVYNMAGYLDQTIASWTGQTLKDIEIIFIDDGSTDDSLRKLEDRARTDNRIHVCSFSTNKGTWAARNYGIEKATGQYILFADADDTVLPETCKDLALAMDEAQVDILHSLVKVLNPNNLPEQEVSGAERWLNPYEGEGQYYGKEVFTVCFRQRKYCWNLSGKIFKTEICKKVLGDIVSMGIKDKYFLISDDALLYFMLSYTAQSYKVMHGKRYFQVEYFKHCRLDGGNYTIEYFESLCMQSLVSAQMKEFLAIHAELDIYEDIIFNIRKDFLSKTVWSWINNLTDSDKAHGFDIMLCYWNSADVIGILAEFCFKNPENIAKYVQNSTAIKYDCRKVKTIAAYYYRLSYGGTERVLCQLCWLWKTMGYKVIVLTDKEPSEDDFKLPSGTQRITIPDINAITSKNYITRCISIQRIIKDYKIDVVVYHDWLQTKFLWDELSIKSCGAAFIVHCHNIFPIGMLWMNRYDVFVDQFILPDAIVAIAKTYCSFWKYYNSNVHVTFNPLSEDITDWNPIRYQNNHRILWLARLSFEKNPLDIIPIMQDVVRAVPDAFLSIVGRSENSMIEEQLQKEIIKLHLEDHIKLEGFHNNVRPWYLSSQIFLMTSTFEGDPMTLRESKMAGIPCVMYELPYLTLCEGNRGIIPVPQRDTKAAAQAIIKLLQDDTMCAQYGQDARAHIEELAQYDFKKKWQQIFESVEHAHPPIGSKVEKGIVEMLIAYHEKSLQKTKRELDSRNREIYQLRHGNYIKRVAIAVIPNRTKPYLKAILHRIPQRIKNPIKRLLNW